MTTPQFVYLHGFASAPTSGKAESFQQRLAEYGLALHTPDLNVPSFERLTLSGMLAAAAITVEALPDGPVHLIGSSMGAMVALHLCHMHRDGVAQRVEKLLLLAPGYDFVENRRRALGDDGMAAWRVTGAHPFYNYAEEREIGVHWGLIEDMAQYDTNAVTVDKPILVVHGRQDDVVPFTDSVLFAEGRPNVDLRLIDADHTLHAALDDIWPMAQAFFGLANKD